MRSNPSRRRLTGAAVALSTLIPWASPAAPSVAAAQPLVPRGKLYKEAVLAGVEARSKLVQEIVDSLFSFGELGYQETESARYLVALLRREGFAVQEGYAGIPTAWVARWGSGRPVIALGSDVDGIPAASQKPGVPHADPIVPGAPGHGEGHNSGQAVNVAAALAVRDLMAKEKLPGTLVLWPGVAEELVGAKAYFVRAGLFRDVDVCLFSHVDSTLAVTWGARKGTGLVSVEYTFEGETAHGAVSPWKGRSALDAVELMNVGWNYRREHLRPQHRSHYVVRNGGDQPNVVPALASVWYYFRETEYPRIKTLWELGDAMARAAAQMAGARLASTRVLGAAWPQHFNKPLAEAVDANIRSVGLPSWDEADQALARAVQRALGGEAEGLIGELKPLEGHVADEDNPGGGSDDIGDVSWSVPTVTLRYPANIPGLPGHSYWNAVAMATPIAHKGSTAGAKVMASTLVDLLTDPDLVVAAARYFREVQTKDQRYEPLIRPEDTPALDLNAERMARYRPEMKRFYYDPSRHATYLEQLGIPYPPRAAEAQPRDGAASSTSLGEMSHEEGGGLAPREP